MKDEPNFATLMSRSSTKADELFPHLLVTCEELIAIVDAAPGPDVEDMDALLDYEQELRQKFEYLRTVAEKIRTAQRHKARAERSSATYEETKTG